jgi:hypothetical protein
MEQDLAVQWQMIGDQRWHPDTEIHDGTLWNVASDPGGDFVASPYGWFHTPSPT